MCGISFIHDKKEKLSEEPIRRMMASLNHRGPDSASYHRHASYNSQFFFASNRLKISDKGDEANQPFFSKNRSQLILFNGEIYNYSDLKNKLIQRGVRFYSHSDTEVLLYWVMTFGAEGVKELNGMFAFLYFDFQREQLIMARDRFGMKPLYYFNSGDYLIICSEIKGIFSTGLVEKELNIKQIPHYFKFRYAAPPQTFYKNIFQLGKGNLLEVKEGTLQFSEYSTSDVNSPEKSSHDIISIKEKIRESILKQIHADYDVGLLLSGGVDSSLLLCIAQEEGVHVPVFSVFSPENKGERKRAEWLTRKFGSFHNILEVDESLLSEFGDYINRLDQPISDSVGLLTYKICNEAAGQVKILLSGAGADELFAGYNRHLAYYFYLKFKKYLPVPKELINSFSNVFPGIKNSNIYAFLSNVERNERATFYNYISSHFSNLRGLMDVGDDDEIFTSDYFDWALQHDRNNYLPEDVLSISDAMSMQAGVELRMPFLDNELLNMVNDCEASYLIRNGRKWILNEILKEYVSSNFIKQKKSGFGLPLRQWLRSAHSEQLWELFSNKNSLIFDFLDREFFYHLLSTHQSGKGDVEQELWSILTLAHWLKKEFE